MRTPLSTRTIFGKFWCEKGLWQYAARQRVMFAVWVFTLGAIVRVPWSRRSFLALGLMRYQGRGFWP